METQTEGMGMSWLRLFQDTRLYLKKMFSVLVSSFRNCSKSAIFSQQYRPICFIFVDSAELYFLKLPELFLSFEKLNFSYLFFLLECTCIHFYASVLQIQPHKCSITTGKTINNSAKCCINNECIDKHV